MKHAGLLALLVCVFGQGMVVPKVYGMAPPKPQDQYNNTIMHSDASDWFWGALGIAGAATGVYAFGRWCGWWGPLSNDALLEQGRKDVLHSQVYQELINTMCRARQDKNNIYIVDEPLLYDLALAKRTGAAIDGYLRSLEKDIDRMHDDISRLHERMMQLGQSECTQEIQYIYESMQVLATELEQQAHELTRVHDYLYQHRSYFHLFEAEDRLAQKYARELQLLQEHGYDWYACNKGLRSSVMSQHDGAFALIHFVKGLRRDQANLKRVLDAPAYNYATRIGFARSLYDSLQAIQEYIVSDENYTQLVAEYERVEREKERLRLERQRIQAEQRVAAAKEREAYAREREAYAREYQAHTQHFYHMHARNQCPEHGCRRCA